MLLTTFENIGDIPAYFPTAREHEVVFRGVLAHIQSGSAARSAALRMPGDISVRAPLDDLLATCHPKSGDSRFAVGDFLVGPRKDSELMGYVGDLATNQVLIYFGTPNPGTLSGAEAICRYEINADGLPVFQETVLEMNS